MEITVMKAIVIYTHRIIVSGDTPGQGGVGWHARSTRAVKRQNEQVEKVGQRFYCDSTGKVGGKQGKQLIVVSLSDF